MLLFLDLRVQDFKGKGQSVKFKLRREKDSWKRLCRPIFTRDLSTKHLVIAGLWMLLGHLSYYLLQTNYSTISSVLTQTDTVEFVCKRKTFWIFWTCKVFCGDIAPFLSAIFDIPDIQLQLWIRTVVPSRVPRAMYPPRARKYYTASCFSISMI